MPSKDASFVPLEHLGVKENRDGWSKVIIGPEEIGQTCSLSMLILLCEVCSRRIDLDLNMVTWESLIERHRINREKQRLNPWAFGIGERERCLLYHAIKYGQYFLVRALLEAGASPHGAFDSEEWPRREHNISCLQMAVMQSCPHTICILLQFQAKMQNFISGKSILDQIVLDQNIEVLDYLFHSEDLNLWLGEKHARQLMAPLQKLVAEANVTKDDFHSKEKLIRVIRLINMLGGNFRTLNKVTVGSFVGSQTSILALPSHVAVEFSQEVEPVFIDRRYLDKCEKLFRNHFWPFVYTINIPPITLNEYKHYYATLMSDAEQYLDLDVKIVDKVAFFLSCQNRARIASLDAEKRTTQSVRRRIKEPRLIGYGSQDAAEVFVSYSKETLVTFEIPKDCLQVTKIQLKSALKYKTQTDESYPINSEHGIFIFIVHPHFGDVVKIPFRSIDFRKEPIPADQEDFVNIDHSLGSLQFKEEVYKFLTGGFKIEVRAECATFYPWSFMVEKCEASIEFVKWACNTQEWRSEEDVLDGHVVVRATYPDGSIQSYSFLAKNPVSPLFEKLQDYEIVLNNGTESLTHDSCDGVTFSDIADGSSKLFIEYRLQNKFKNTSLLNFINIFGKKVMKATGGFEEAAIFLRDPNKELVMIYVDEISAEDININDNGYAFPSNADIMLLGNDSATLNRFFLKHIARDCNVRFVNPELSNLTWRLATFNLSTNDPVCKWKEHVSHKSTQHVNKDTEKEYVSSSWEDITNLGIQSGKDVIPFQNWMEGRGRYVILALIEKKSYKVKKQLRFLEQTDIKSKAIVLPFGFSDGYPYSIAVHDDETTQLRQKLKLSSGSHFVLIDCEKESVLCKSIGRYLVYDKNCYDFPWTGNVSRLLRSKFLSVTKLENMDEFDHIPRTCFFIGNEAKISNITLPTIDLMRKVMMTTGLPPPVRLCIATGQVERYLRNTYPTDLNFRAEENDVLMVTVHLDCKYFPIHWWGRVETSEDIESHLLSVFQRENPYIRVMALSIQSNSPYLFWVMNDGTVHKQTLEFFKDKDKLPEESSFWFLEATEFVVNVVDSLEGIFILLNSQREIIRLPSSFLPTIDQAENESVSVRYDENRKELVKQFVPGFHKDGSFAFGQYMVPMGGVERMSAFHYMTFLASQNSVFTPNEHFLTLRESLMRRVSIEFLAESKDWRTFAGKSLKTNSIPYSIRVDQRLDKEKVKEIIHVRMMPAMDPDSFQSVCAEQDMPTLENHIEKETDFSRSDDSGRTILHWLCAELWLEGLERFFSSSPNIDTNQQDEDGYTPLFCLADIERSKRLASELKSDDGSSQYQMETNESLTQLQIQLQTQLQNMVQEENDTGESNIRRHEEVVESLSKLQAMVENLSFSQTKLKGTEEGSMSMPHARASDSGILFDPSIEYEGPTSSLGYEYTKYGSFVGETKDLNSDEFEIKINEEDLLAKEPGVGEITESIQRKSSITEKLSMAESPSLSTLWNGRLNQRDRYMEADGESNMRHQEVVEALNQLQAMVRKLSFSRGKRKGTEEGSMRMPHARVSVLASKKITTEFATMIELLEKHDANFNMRVNGDTVFGRFIRTHHPLALSLLRFGKKLLVRHDWTKLLGIAKDVRNDECAEFCKVEYMLSRSPNQDRTLQIHKDVVISPTSGDKFMYKIEVLVMCDGHGANGAEVSQFNVDFIEKEIFLRFETKFMQGENSMNTLLTNLVSDCNRALSKSQIDIQFSGSTLLICVIFGGNIWVANLGDSRAVLAKNLNGILTATPLSRDANPDEEDFLQVITAKGGKVSVAVHFVLLCCDLEVFLINLSQF